jgi:RNA polymerase sigma-70 factor (ECF subfamily)
LLHNGVQELATPAPHASERSLSGNVTASDHFDELFLSHYTLIVRLLARMLGDYARAEDLANEAFLKLYRRPSLHGSHGNLGGWLYRTAMNLGIDALRAAARRDRYETAAARAETKTQAREDGLHQLLRAEKQQRVRRALACLKPVYAQALFLRVCGYSYKELADSLAIEPASVGTLLLRAEAEFEKHYVAMYGREEAV